MYICKIKSLNIFKIGPPKNQYSTKRFVKICCYKLIFDRRLTKDEQKLYILCLQKLILSIADKFKHMRYVKNYFRISQTYAKIEGQHIHLGIYQPVLGLIGYFKFNWLMIQL